MESDGDRLGRAAAPADGFIDEKHDGEEIGQYESGTEPVQPFQPEVSELTEPAGANGRRVRVGESSLSETPQPSEPIYDAVQRQFNSGDESERSR